MTNVTMTNTNTCIAHDQLALLQRWYRKICDLQTIKFDGRSKVHLEISAAYPLGSIVLTCQAPDKRLTLLNIGERWLISAQEGSTIAWRLGHSVSGDTMLALIEQTIKSFLLCPQSLPPGPHAAIDCALISVKPANPPRIADQ